MTQASLFDGVAVTKANGTNPINGEYYLKNTGGEFWNLYTDAGLTTSPVVQSGGFSDYLGGGFVAERGHLIAGHSVFSPGDVARTRDPRASSSHPDHIANPAHMWAPGSTNGSQSQNVTLEIKATSGSIANGTQVELIESFWTELNNGTYYVQTTTADAGARFLLWNDPGFTSPVVPSAATFSLVGDSITGLGGDGSGYWDGYLFSTLNGRLVVPASSAVPEPSTYIMLLTGGLGLVCFRMKRKRQLA